MRQPSSSVLPETGSDREDRHRRAAGRAPVVERIAGWSARHRKTAVLGWLALVAAVFVSGQMLRAKNLPSYDAGAVGPGRADPAAARGGLPAAGERADPGAGARPAGLTDPQMRQAIRQVVTALSALPRSARDIISPLVPARWAGRRGRPERPGHLPCPRTSQQRRPGRGPALRAVARTAARHPGLRIDRFRRATCCGICGKIQRKAHHRWAYKCAR